MTQNIDLLKEVLSVPSKTYKEDLMVEFLVNWLTENNIEHYVDKHKNVYFIQVYFASSPNILGIYQTKLNLDKNILRSMVINVSK